MIIIARILEATAYILGYVLEIYKYVLFGRALISWLNADPRNQFVQIIQSMTEPTLKIVRKQMTKLGISPYHSGIDISFIVLILLIMFLEIALVRSLADLAMSLRYSPA